MFAVNAVAHSLVQPLTEIEALGLSSKFDLANGHASQDLSSSQQKIVERLPHLWLAAAKQKSAEAEDVYKQSFQYLAKTPALAHHNAFKICPTASNSIDIVATWLAYRQLKTALIEPTFDNLALILKRRGVDLKAIPETEILQGSFSDTLSDVDAVFLVNPNNPTGTTLSSEQVFAIISWCAENQKVLAFDNTFRFFVPQTYDLYQMLLDSGVTFASIEDTGKVWPTQEIKASMLVCSNDIFKDIDLIYDEIFLCASNFALAILSEFLQDAADKGLENAVWQPVAERRNAFRAAIAGSSLTIHPASLESLISVEWVQISDAIASDLHLAEYFKARNLILLPGRQFYWSQRETRLVTNCARFALLKSARAFSEAVDVLYAELVHLKLNTARDR